MLRQGWSTPWDTSWLAIPRDANGPGTQRWPSPTPETGKGAIQEKALGADHPDVALTLNNLALLALAEAQPQSALPLLERAAIIYAARDGVQNMEFETRFNLARALVATHGDRDRALVAARSARDGFREAGAGKARELAEVERWLAAHE